MTRTLALVICLMTLCLAGVVLANGIIAQSDDEPPRLSFRIDGEIGRALPRKIVYDPNFDRYAIVDAYNRLLLVDGPTFETQHILYESGQYNDIQFSHSGEWFALAIGQRIELYDANSGQLVSQLDNLSEAIRVVGPLAFSRDDNLLKFEGVYPAPRSIRVRENQTIQTPWLWNLTAARNEGESSFPRRLEAWQFFDYRNGFAIGPNDQIVAALPGRLQIVDANTLEQRFDIRTDRYENDPMRVWISLRDDKIYIRPTNETSLVQVDTDRGALAETPLNQTLTLTDLALLGGVELSDQAMVIGGDNSSPLKLELLGDRRTQRDRYGIGELTVTLIDLILPPARSEDNVAAFIFVFNEWTETGRFELRTVGSQMILSPDESNILVRTSGENEQIITYDLTTGRELRRLTPSLRNIGAYRRNNKNRVLDFDASASVIVSDFQRYDAATNAILAEDLRYSRRFDRFYFTDDSENVVTLSGSEWRVWDRSSGETLRREALAFNGAIMRDRDDGFHYLTHFSFRLTSGELRKGVEIMNLQNSAPGAPYDNTGEGVTRQSLTFEQIPGSHIELIVPSPDWRQHLIVYSENAWGEYPPGNQIALYDMDAGRRWLIAGDDLPPPNARDYGWVDNDTVYIRGEGYAVDQPARIFGAEYDPTGLPACIVEQFPDQVEPWTALWERMVYRARNDELNRLTLRICAESPQTVAAAAALLEPTRTPIPVTVTPIRIEGVPVCLTALFPDEAEDYAQLWIDLTTGLTGEQIAEAETLICEGVWRTSDRFAAAGGEFIEETMLIDLRNRRSLNRVVYANRIRRAIQRADSRRIRKTNRPQSGPVHSVARRTMVGFVQFARRTGDIQAGHAVRNPAARSDGDSPGCGQRKKPDRRSPNPHADL